MTREYIEGIVDKLLAAPKMFSEKPTGVLPTLYLSRDGYPFASAESADPYFGSTNLFLCTSGYDVKKYSGIVLDYGQIRYSKSTTTGLVDLRTRYVSLHDLKMMVYIGMEYAKQKCFGYRYRLGQVGGDDNASQIPGGYICRLSGGRRFVHKPKGLGNVTSPHGSGLSLSHDRKWTLGFWTPVQRRCAFINNGATDIMLPQSYMVNRTEGLSEIVKVGEIDGDDELLIFRGEQGTACVNSSRYLNENLIDAPAIRSGSYSIFLSPDDITSDFLSPDDAISEYRLENAIQAFGATFKEQFRASNDPYFLEDSRDNVYVPRGAKVVSAFAGSWHGNVIPVKKGQHYNIFARLVNAFTIADSGEKQKYGRLCTMIRIGTKMVAPKFTDNSHW